MPSAGIVNRRDIINSWGQDVASGPVSAHMVLSNDDLTFTATENGVDPSPQLVTVDTSTGTLAGVRVGTIAYGVGWAAGVTATVISTLPAVVSIQPAVTGLSPATYTATIPVTDTSADNSPQNITITFTVNAAPQAPLIDTGGSSFVFSGTTGSGNTADQTITVTNAGGGTFAGLAIGNVQYGAGATGWLVGSISGNVITGHARLTNVLTAGNYTATFDVTDASASNSPKTVQVQLAASTPAIPTMNFSQTQLAFTAVQGAADPTPLVITITNTGSGSLAGPAVGVMSYTPAGSWLNSKAVIATVTAGQSYTLTISPATGALTAATYNVSFPVTDASATNSPVTVTIQFTVTTAPQPGNFPAPRFKLMQGTSSNATFNALDGKITYNPFTNNGIEDPDGNPNSAGYRYSTNPALTFSCNSQATLVTALASAAAAADGAIVEITGDFTISSTVTIPAKTSTWTLIRSANPCAAVEGDRVAPANFTASHPYKISCSGTDAAFEMAAGSDGWHLRDIWLDNTASSEKTTFFNWAFPDNAGNTGNGQRTTAEMPERLKVERCYFTNNFNNSTKFVARLLALSGRYCRVVQSYLDGGCKNGSSDSQGILITNTLGDIQIEDNTIEGASENVFLGGGRVWMGTQNYNHNIHVRGNYLPKRLAWTTGATGASGGSTVFKQIKNFFEVKHGRYVVFEDNYLENHNGSSILGNAGQFVDISIKVSPYSAAEQAFIRTNDITVRNNLSINGVGSIECDNGDDHAGFPSNALPVGDVEFRNNAFITPRYPSSDTVADMRNLIGGKGLASKRMFNIVLDHNWFGDRNSGMVFTTPTTTAGGAYITGLIVTNNIWWQNVAYQAVMGQSVTSNKPALNAVCGVNPPTGAPTWTFAKNAIVHSAGANDLYGTGSASLQPAPYSNITFASTTALANVTSTSPTHRSALVGTSIYQTGTDSRDIGPDWDELQRALAALT